MDHPYFIDISLDKDASKQLAFDAHISGLLVQFCIDYVVDVPAPDPE